MKDIILFAYIFSLPFEYWDPFGIAEFLTVPKAMGFLYLVSRFIKCNETKTPLLAINNNSKTFFWFILYYAAVSVIFSLAENKPITSGDISFLLSLVLCIIMYTCLLQEMQNPEMQAKMLTTLKISLVCITFLMYIGIGAVVGESGRLTFWGNNSNTLGIYGVICIYFALSNGPKQLFFRIALLVCGAFLTQKSGSITVILLLPIVLLGNMLKLGKTRSIFIIIATVIFLAFTFFLFYSILLMDEDSIILQRITNFEVYDADENTILSGRLEIWDYAKDLFYSYPLTGVGQVVTREYFIEKLGLNRAIHSLYLELFAKTGLIGFCLYLYPLVNVTKKVLLHPTKKVDITILLLIMILFLGKSGGCMIDKLIWLLFAYLVTESEKLAEEPSYQEKENGELLQPTT